VISPSTNSALPSKPVESLIRDGVGVIVSELILPGHDEGKMGWELEPRLLVVYFGKIHDHVHGGSCKNSSRCWARC
jgi:hypothetical protein